MFAIRFQLGSPETATPILSQEKIDFQNPSFAAFYILRPTTFLRLSETEILFNRFFHANLVPMDQIIQSQQNDHILQWTQWQLLDSVLPTGGFAHSFGLEAAIQSHIVNDPRSLKLHLTHVIENTASLLLPFVYAANRSPDTATWRKLDGVLEAMLTNEVGRKASASQGSALVRVAAAVFSEKPVFREMREAVVGPEGAHCHHAAVFGLISGVFGFDGETAQRSYLFMTLRDSVSAATRLNLIGPLGAAALQHEMGEVGERILTRWMNRTVEEACQTAPLMDAVQGCHNYLFSRLFCS